MASNLKITVNGQAWPVAANLDTPLLYVLTNELHLHGPRFAGARARCTCNEEGLRSISQWAGQLSEAIYHFR